MRYIHRIDLDREINEALQEKQRIANQKREAGTLDQQQEWKNARKTLPLETVRATLKQMMGPYEPCMYCLLTHGTDIEHFWPKSKYPQHMFQWPNLLLCCSECNEFKGEWFPLDAGGEPLLIDPTKEDPWNSLDFDPETGNLGALVLETRSYSPKGIATVKALKLNERETLSREYRRIFRHISRDVEAAIEGNLLPDQLVAQLQDTDHHGLLLGWCFNGNGQNIPPFSQLRQLHPQHWSACRAACP